MINPLGTISGDCTVSEYCENAHRCLECSGAFPLEDALDIELPLLYVRKDRDAPALHPIQVERKRLKKHKNQALRQHKSSSPRLKNLRQLRSSQVNERKTREAIVRQTLASGSVIGDGDTRLGDGSIGLDDKLMSRAHKQFTITLDAIDKARRQACMIVVTTAEGRKFAVMELDYLLSSAAAISELGTT